VVQEEECEAVVDVLRHVDQRVVSLEYISVCFVFLEKEFEGFVLHISHLDNRILSECFRQSIDRVDHEEVDRYEAHAQQRNHQDGKIVKSETCNFNSFSLADVDEARKDNIKMKGFDNSEENLNIDRFVDF
jgi:hypothetical protein